MTPARDPKQCVILNKSMQKAAGKHLGGIWQHLRASGSIWEHLGGIWRHLRASGSIWEASRRHLGGIWGSIWERPGETWEVQATWEASGSRLRSKPCVLSKKVARATISRTRDEPDLHVVGKFTATYDHRPAGTERDWYH